ncbi:aminodeoxychorismate synthase component I (plasmid) [Azospirillum oryzae]|uniref:aminodeoxychorismate synthase n=1 Tax=Azospirillum oryzae TaxID=286727 RepID=A0A6N1AJW8_9PROT|nr:aminodeoxychorismate synthase component I [Azospirillum oryzae]KAA0587313.1 aminodeoxychorismate synthase component I [Azospirillum oryzae]QKS50627.1 aminodeoxychorismate synthase component I [Azospirillum oryzae]GLR81833.1 para-aminobenzoate synthase [Azospirillum oryzae]
MPQDGLVFDIPAGERAGDGYPLVIREIPYRDPVAAFAPWSGQPFAALLHSAAEGGGRGRWSIVAVEPFRTIEARGGSVTVDGHAVAGDPFTVLEEQLDAHRLPVPPDLPVPFAGGAVGFLGYELGQVLERLPARHGDDSALPDMAFGLYDTVIVFDELERRGWILSSGFPESSPVGRRLRAADRLQSIAEHLEAAPTVLPPPHTATASWQPEIARDDYCRRVEQVLEYIRAGDIFQANFTGRFLADRPAGLSVFDLYRRLLALSPAPFAACLTLPGGYGLASASPERFIRLHADGRMETRPIKGTRPRGATADEDDALARELEHSIKDRAENLMITDLLRNDIGRVARIGSVKVPVLCGVERFASVLHLVSVIEGQLKPGLGPVDLLRATFPGGSITGAPKIRAMEIIDELEVSRRGAYCGSVAWIGFDGAMDSSIVIRTLTVTPDRVIAQAGGGIVADSDPGREHDEMMVKIGPQLRALDGG